MTPRWLPLCTFTFSEAEITPMDSSDDTRTSWSEITTRVERKRPVAPLVYEDGASWSTIESVTVTVVRSGSSDSMPPEPAS